MSDETSPKETSRKGLAAQRVGTTLRAKWHLDALLGIGGMAAVYAATHRNGMRGAVKLLDDSYSADSMIRRRFLQEGYIANKVEHVGAVRVLDDDTAEDGAVFLVMELLEGTPLDELAQSRGGKLSIGDTLVLMAQLLDTLAVAHAAGIVHRDLKPENLFLTHPGVLKVLDFGLARIFENEAPASFTSSGIAMGTPAFMSPEQARGRWSLVNAQSDLWSVGATMFMLLSGQYVHGGEGTIAEMLAATFHKPAPSLRAVLPDAPEPLVTLVDRALMLKMAERWLDAKSMHRAVESAYEQIVGQRIPPLPSQSLPQRGSLPSGLFGLTTSSTRTSRPPSDLSPTLPRIETLGSVPPAVPSAAPKRARSNVVPVGVAVGVAAVLAIGFGVTRVVTHPAAEGPPAAAGALIAADAEVATPDPDVIPPASQSASAASEPAATAPASATASVVASASPTVPPFRYTAPRTLPPAPVAPPTSTATAARPKGSSIFDRRF